MEIEDHPSALRNRQPIFEVLTTLLASDARVLEVASGNGTHGAYCTAAMPGLHWQPSEADPDKLAVLTARYQQQDAGVGIQAPIPGDVLTFDWSSHQVDAVLAINLVHIAPFSVTKALFAGARQALRIGGNLLLYGPYKVNGQHTASSNAEFDVSLRTRDASWGIRDIQELTAVASSLQLALTQRIEMPANNQFLVFSQQD